MQDIEIVHAEVVWDKFVHIMRRHTEGDRVWESLQRMPKETLALRAFEYDGHYEDPKFLDHVLLEHLIETSGDEQFHPLFTEEIPKALEIVEDRIEGVRTSYGAPQGENRLMAHAVSNKAASKGLVVVRDLLLRNADDKLRDPVVFFRDMERQRVAKGNRSLGEEMTDMMERLKTRADRPRTRTAKDGSTVIR